MKLTPPTKLEQLARDLGIGPKQLASLRVKHKTEAKLISTLQSWWRQTRDEPRLLARRSQQGYTNTRGEAMSGKRTDDGYEDEPEAVDDITQKRITRDAKDRELEQVMDAVNAAENVLSAIRERSQEQPSLKRAYWPLRRELDRFIRRERNKAA